MCDAKGRAVWACHAESELMGVWGERREPCGPVAQSDLMGVWGERREPCGPVAQSDLMGVWGAHRGKLERGECLLHMPRLGPHVGDQMRQAIATERFTQHRRQSARAMRHVAFALAHSDHDLRVTRTRALGTRGRLK